MSRSQFAVYQLKKKPELRNLFFRTYEELAQDQIPVQVANYEHWRKNSHIIIKVMQSVPVMC